MLVSHPVSRLELLRFNYRLHLLAETLSLHQQLSALPLQQPSHLPSLPLILTATSLQRGCCLLIGVFLDSYDNPESRRLRPTDPAPRRQDADRTDYRKCLKQPVALFVECSLAIMGSCHPCPSPRPEQPQPSLSLVHGLLTPQHCCSSPSFPPFQIQSTLCPLFDDAFI